MVTDTPLDAAKLEAFAGSTLNILNGASVAISLSLGHRLGLFDRLAELEPSTSHQIANATGLQERYVREWLAVMVVGGVIVYDPQRKTYDLPPEHAAFLTRAAGPNNFAQFSQYIACVGAIEEPLVGAFRNGGGVPYELFPRIYELQREESAAAYDAGLVAAILPLVPGLVAELDRGIEALDIGCGAGHAVNVMAQAFPKSRFAGYDLGAPAIAMGADEAKGLGLTNARFQVQDVASFDEPGRFDLITAFDTIHDQARPRDVLKAAYRALKPGGTFFCQDMAGSSNLEENLDHPLASMLYMASLFHCMTVSLSQGGEGLGTMWGEQKAHELFAEAGFASVMTERLESDPVHVYYVMRK